jgi:predicted transcriptional regulator
MNRIFSLLRPSRKIQLGPLEQDLLERLWKCETATVRELLQDEKLKLAYTTVMTTLDRLYKKDLLDRVAEGRAFRYSPRYSKQELQRQVAGQAIRDLLGSEPSSVPLSYLVEVVSDHDAHALEDLQELIERKRQELQSRDQEKH